MIPQSAVINGVGVNGARVNGRRAWGIVALLFLFSMVNFFDKLVMGLAAVPIMREFHLSPSQYGALGSSFYFLYAISGVLVGLFVVSRISPKWLLTILVLIWTVSQVPMVLGSSLMALYVGRMLLGVGEGPATPSAYHTLYGWFTSEQRSFPTSVLLAGIGMGFLIGSPIISHIIADYGWRAGFLFCGAVGVVWMVLWAVFGADGPLIERASAAATATDRVPWGRFWADPTVVATIVIASASYWVTGLSITWLAPYLQIGLGYTPRDTGWLISVILGSQVVIQVAISYASHRMLLSGMSSRVSRGLVTGFSVFLAGVAMWLVTLTGPTTQVLLLAFGFTLPQLVFVIGPAIIGEIAPASQRGTALLVTFSVMTLTGLLSPIVTGWVVQAAGDTPLVGYTNALWLTAAVLAFGGIWGLIALNPEATRARFTQARTRTLHAMEPRHAT